jgi:hypothetical protein
MSLHTFTGIAWVIMWLIAFLLDRRLRAQCQRIDDARDDVAALSRRLIDLEDKLENTDGELLALLRAIDFRNLQKGKVGRYDA